MPCISELLQINYILKAWSVRLGPPSNRTVTWVFWFCTKVTRAEHSSWQVKVNFWPWLYVSIQLHWDQRKKMGGSVGHYNNTMLWYQVLIPACDLWWLLVTYFSSGILVYTEQKQSVKNQMYFLCLLTGFKMVSFGFIVVPILSIDTSALPMYIEFSGRFDFYLRLSHWIYIFVYFSVFIWLSPSGCFLPSPQ